MTQTIEREFIYNPKLDYYVIGARNAWDQVPIGLFNSWQSAKNDLDCCASDKCIRKATQTEIITFFGLV